MTSPVVARFLERLDGVRSDGTGWSARCPCRQDDQNPSLHVGEGDDGRVLVTCHRGGGCTFDQIIDAMHLKKADVFPNTTTGTDREIVDTYKYTDETGRFAYAKIRYRNPDGTKAFSQYRIVNGEKIHSLGDTPRYLYRLPEILAAIENGTPVNLVEGERDVHTAETLGKVATTMTDGAGKWRNEYTQQLTGARINIIADNDDAGLDHAYLVARRLRANGCSVKIFVPPDPHNDLTDLITAGGTLKDLTQLDPPPTEPPPEPAPDHGVQYGTIGLHVRNWSQWLDEPHDDSYDWIIPGLLERTDRVLVVAAEGAGKALDLNEPILTTNGWSTIGQLTVGDQVFDRHGKPCNVVALSPINPTPDARWITFSTGERIRACVDHQWLTVTTAERLASDPLLHPHRIRTTAEIETTLDATHAMTCMTPDRTLVTRYITAVEPADPVPMRCLMVDSPDHSYLVGTTLIPTHNSMLSRQIAICTSVGLDPFTREPIPALRTLTIDLENPDRVLRRKSAEIMTVAKKMARYTGHPPAELIVKPDGVDLLDPGWRTELETVITATKPDLICLGPIYKAYIDSGKNHINNTIIELVRYLDHIRITHNCALWLEHHAPLSDGGTRTLRPIDSSVWQRWPEFGLALDPDIDATTPYTYKLRHFRGARDERNWPNKLTRGRTLPFDPTDL